MSPDTLGLLLKPKREGRKKPLNVVGRLASILVVPDDHRHGRTEPLIAEADTLFVEGMPHKQASLKLNPNGLGGFEERVAERTVAPDLPKTDRRTDGNFQASHRFRLYGLSAHLARFPLLERVRFMSGSVPTAGDLCEHHAQLAAELGRETVVNGDHTKKRSARQRLPVIAEAEPIELTSHNPDRPSAVRPALTVTAAEEVETIRRVLLEAATSTSRQSWATCTCPECGKSFRQEISVPDHGARIKGVETLLREGLGRVGEAEVAEPRMPASVAEIEALSWSEMKFIFAISYAQAIEAFVDQGEEALRSELERWEPEARATVARALAEVA